MINGGHSGRHLATVVAVSEDRRRPDRSGRARMDVRPRSVIAGWLPQSSEKDSVNLVNLTVRPIGLSGIQDVRGQLYWRGRLAIAGP